MTQIAVSAGADATRAGRSGWHLRRGPGRAGEQVVDGAEHQVRLALSANGPADCTAVEQVVGCPRVRQSMGRYEMGSHMP